MSELYRQTLQRAFSTNMEEQTHNPSKFEQVFEDDLKVFPDGLHFLIAALPYCGEQMILASLRNDHSPVDHTDPASRREIRRLRTSFFPSLRWARPCKGFSVLATDYIHDHNHFHDYQHTPQYTHQKDSIHCPSAGITSFVRSVCDMFGTLSCPLHLPFCMFRRTVTVPTSTKHNRHIPSSSRPCRAYCTTWLLGRRDVAPCQRF